MTTIQKMISYFGVADTGKTSTLNKLITLLNNNSNYKLIHCEGNNKKNQPTKETLTVTNNYDKKAVFKCLKTTKIIVITTTGDNQSQILKNCEFFLKHSANIAITANRTQGAPHKKLNDFCKQNNIPVFWKIGIQKMGESTQEEFDNFMADTLFNAIKIELEKNE